MLDMIWCDAMRYDTIRYDTLRYDTIRYDTITIPSNGYTYCCKCKHSYLKVNFVFRVWHHCTLTTVKVSTNSNTALAEKYTCNVGRAIRIQAAPATALAEKYTCNVSRANRIQGGTWIPFYYSIIRATLSYVVSLDHNILRTTDGHLNKKLINFSIP